MGHLAIELPNDLEQRLESEARRQGRPPGDLARDLLIERVLELPEAPTTEPIAGLKPAWQRFVEAGRSLPADVVQRLPQDGARNLEHYLYGGASDKPRGQSLKHSD